MGLCISLCNYIATQVDDEWDNPPPNAPIIEWNTYFNEIINYEPEIELEPNNINEQEPEEEP